MSSPSAHIDAVGVDDLIARQEVCLNRQLEWIRAIDSKVPIVIGLATAMLALVGAVSPAPMALSWGTGVLMAIGSLPLVACLWWCAAATFPHTRGPSGSRIYFRGIAETPYATYAREMCSRSPSDHLADLNTQCHRNAQIAAAKYKAVQLALLSLFAATPIWLVACYLLYKG